MNCAVRPYEGTEPYIFLSYCHADARLVYPLFETIARAGYRVWYDDGNHPGDDWVENIARHIASAQVCMVFLTENAVASHNCRSELSFALELEKKTAAAILGTFEMPLGIRMQLSAIHFVKSEDHPTLTQLLQKLLETEGAALCRGAAPAALKAPVPPEQSVPAARPVQPVPPTQPMQQAQPIPPTQVLQPVQVVILESSAQAAEKPAASPEPRQPQALLIFPTLGRVQQVSGKLVRLGRSVHQTEVTLENADTVSNLHAQLTWNGSTYVLQDAGSSNGTYYRGIRLEQAMELESAAVFWLYKIPVVILMGSGIAPVMARRQAVFLMNASRTAACFVQDKPLLLNRSQEARWPDGTLADRLIHRDRHAMVSFGSDGVYLRDDSPDGGNGTYLNDRRLGQREARRLKHGDLIRLGNTTLEMEIIGF